MTRKLLGTAKLLSVFFMCLTLLMAVGCSLEQSPQAPQATSSSSQPTAQSSTALPSSAPGAPSGGPQSTVPIQVGMSSQQVLEIMGKPNRIEQEGQYTEWKYYTPQGKWELYLQNDKVAFIKRH
jgi:outer membrane protein assembly factor BamE (lipoprotein component of BamABCDE complex)